MSSQKLSFSNIKRFEIGGPKHGGILGPTLGLYIYTFSGNEPIATVNIKPFARDDIALLMDSLNHEIHKRTVQ